MHAGVGADARTALKHSDPFGARESTEACMVGSGKGVNISLHQDESVDKLRALGQHRPCNPIETG
jgi:hypothetical protein